MDIQSYMIETRNYMIEIEQTDRYRAYGNFLDRFRNCKDRELQAYLIKDKPINSHKYPIDLAIISAVAERFAHEYELEVPAWVYDDDCFLDEPHYGGARLPEMKQLNTETALPEFKKRKLYLGDNIMNRA